MEIAWPDVGSESVRIYPMHKYVTVCVGIGHSQPHERQFLPCGTVFMNCSLNSCMGREINIGTLHLCFSPDYDLLLEKR